MIGRRLAHVLLFLLSVSSCSRREVPAAATNEPAVVSVQAATVQTLRDTVTLPGVVVPAAAADLTIIAPEPARVVELPKAEGDAVAPGDLLARFDIAAVTDEVETRQREFNDATARATRARAEVTRLTPLYEKGVIARNTYDATKAAQTTAESALTLAKGQLDATRLLQERTIVRARFPGVVAKRWHNEGDLVAGGVQDPVLRVIDPSRIQVAVQVPTAQLARLSPGQSATIQTGAGTAEAATIVVRPAPADPSTTTAELRLAPVGQMALALDTPVQVEILLDERRDAVVIPSAAILRAEQTSYVLIAGTDHRAHRREIRVGLLTRGVAQVLSGVTPGELVIVGGLDTIADGMAISINR